MGDISQGQTVPAYQEYTLTIAPSDRRDIYAVFNYFRPIAQSGGALAVKFGDNGVETPYTGVGIGLDCEDTFSRVTLINTGATPLVITVALANGRISDDRLNISGAVMIGNFPAVQKISEQHTDFAASQVAVGNTAAQLVTAAATNGEITIEAGITDLFIGKTAAVTTANGFLIPAGGSFTMKATCDFYGIRAGASQPAYVARGIY